ncbi:hypothetical protein [Haloferula sp. BvORR071]|uniref:hypothetical protein n=1 Tax=Haloferula sp. BvORR071 TaxID=1396141 RepID=UPI000557798C|nr:hypothetical protein [Haloferula sp. BvORR071]
MSRRPLLLIGSHLAVLGLVYGITRGSTHSPSASNPASPHPNAKSADRNNSGPSADGQALLADFIQHQKESSTSPYRLLKATLPVAADPEAAAIEAIRAYSAMKRGEAPNGEEAERQLTELAVRVLHWLRQAKDPAEIIKFLATDEVAREMDLLPSLCYTAIKDAAAEQGITKSWPWLWKNPSTREPFGRVAMEEMKAGGGFALILQLEAAMKGDPLFSSQRRFVAIDPSGKREQYYLQVGTATPFRDRQALFDFAISPDQQEVRSDLLRGFARSSEEAAQWLLEREGLDPEMADFARKRQNFLASSNTSLDYDRRIEALQQSSDQEGKDHQTLLNEMVQRDLLKILTEDRDWRYEFRNGVSSLDDVTAAIRSAMPEVPPEAEEALLVSLYRQLVEEDAKKALPLLDSLPEDRRRDALFNSTWQSMVNIDPDDYLSFFSSLPEPVTAEEKDYRTKGWNWKARGFLMRYGDDYVEWVKQMPPGIDKETAMNSLIWATREQNPAEARKLSDQLYPPKKSE